MKFISDGTWFDKGTEATLVDNCWWGEIKDGEDNRSGLFEGIRTGHRKEYGASNEIIPDYDQEVCSFSEFTITETE